MSIRILILSHSSVTYTGTAEVVRGIFSGLLTRFPDKYRLMEIGLWHTSAVCQPMWPIVPTETRKDESGNLGFVTSDLYGQLTLPRVIESFNPDILFCFNDPQHLSFVCHESILERVKVVLYVPFDGTPVPNVYQYLTRAHKLVTMSNFSKCEFLKTYDQYTKCIEVVYAPIDLNRFKKLTLDEKRSRRQKLSGGMIEETDFVIGWVGRNQWRKQLWSVYSLISMIRHGTYRKCLSCKKTSPIKGSARCSCGKNHLSAGKPMRHVKLWIHIPTGPDGCWSLEDLERMYNVYDGSGLIYTKGCSIKEHLSTDDYPLMYGMWDLMAFLSGGEGFGVPVLEAMASGIPLIFTDYSSHAEVIRKANAGIAVGGVLQPEPGSSVLRMVANGFEALDAFHEIVMDQRRRYRLSSNGIAFAEQCSVARIAERWDSILSSVFLDK